MLDWNITKRKEKVGENNCKMEGRIIQNRKGQNFPDCDANQKWIYQAKILIIIIMSKKLNTIVTT